MTFKPLYLLKKITHTKYGIVEVYGYAQHLLSPDVATTVFCFRHHDIMLGNPKYMHTSFVNTHSNYDL